MSDTAYTYLFIRRDLTTPQQIVQMSHVSHCAGERFGNHSHMVLFGTKDEADLLRSASYLESKGIEFEIFYEPDDETGHTAICTRPLCGEERKLMRRFTLLQS